MRNELCNFYKEYTDKWFNPRFWCSGPTPLPYWKKDIVFLLIPSLIHPRFLISFFHLIIITCKIWENLRTNPPPLSNFPFNPLPLSHHIYAENNWQLVFIGIGLINLIFAATTSAIRTYVPLTMHAIFVFLHIVDVYRHLEKLVYSAISYNNFIFEEWGIL